jgi:hypothetical protein
MKKPKSHAVLLAWIAVALSAVLLVMVFGDGYLYQGALRWKPKVRRVAQFTCLADANKEGNFCAYTLEPIEYFVMKDGENYVIYGAKGGDKIAKILKDNNIELTQGHTYNASSYSLVRSPNYSAMMLGFKFRDGSVPAFTLDKATAATMKDVRFVEVELPRSVKIRFNTFYLP